MTEVVDFEAYRARRLAEQRSVAAETTTKAATDTPWMPIWLMPFWMAETEEAPEA